MTPKHHFIGKVLQYAIMVGQKLERLSPPQLEGPLSDVLEFSLRLLERNIISKSTLTMEEEY